MSTAADDVAVASEAPRSSPKEARRFRRSELRWYRKRAAKSTLILFVVAFGLPLLLAYPTSYEYLQPYRAASAPQQSGPRCDIAYDRSMTRIGAVLLFSVSTLVFGEILHRASRSWLLWPAALGLLATSTWLWWNELFG